MSFFCCFGDRSQKQVVPVFAESQSFLREYETASNLVGEGTMKVFIDHVKKALDQKDSRSAYILLSHGSFVKFSELSGDQLKIVSDGKTHFVSLTPAQCEFWESSKIERIWAKAD